MTANVTPVFGSKVKTILDAVVGECPSRGSELTTLESIIAVSAHRLKIAYGKEKAASVLLAIIKSVEGRS